MDIVVFAVVAAGLNEIVNAIVHARKIFARVRNYCIYRISATLQLVIFLFVVVLSVSVADYFPNKQRHVGSVSTMKQTVKGQLHLKHTICANGENAGRYLTRQFQ